MTFSSGGFGPVEKFSKKPRHSTFRNGSVLAGKEKKVMTFFQGKKKGFELTFLLKKS